MPGDHPYYPIDAEIPGYSANESSLVTILGTAAAGSAVLLGTMLAGISFARPSLSKADRTALLWFMLCMCGFYANFAMGATKLTAKAGSLHCFFEGYFITHHDRMGGAQNLVGQLWKEYALSDSRYMTSNTLVLCMETITVVSPMLRSTLTSPVTNKSKFVWGPLCFCVAYSIFSKHSMRHPLQIVVCVSHVYGDVLYYSTSLVDLYAKGVSYCRPEAYYFWVYYFGMNFIWIVVPACKLGA